MTAAEFRRLALSLPETEERAHMNHPDFRVGGKIFATLGYPDKSWAMVKLFPDQQAEFVAACPQIFVPVKGGWGKQGGTNVLLKAASEERVREALAAAWQNRAPKSLQSKDRARPAKRTLPAKKRSA
jgi:hypothetical protein